MRVNEFTFSRRRNLGNYEHEECTLNMAVSEHDNLDEVIDYTKVKIAEILGLQPTVEQITEVVENGNVNTRAGKTVDPSTGEEVSAEPVKKKRAKKKAKKSTGSKVSAKPAEAPAEPEVILTLEDVKQYLGKVWKAKGKAVAVDILQDFGVEKSDALRVEDYPQVVEQCEKALV